MSRPPARVNAPVFSPFPTHSCRRMLSKLPEDVLLDIIHYLGVRDLLTLRQVSILPIPTSYRVIAHTESLAPLPPTRRVVRYTHSVAATTYGTEPSQNFPSRLISHGALAQHPLPVTSCSGSRSKLSGWTTIGSALRPACEAFTLSLMIRAASTWIKCSSCPGGDGCGRPRGS